MKTASEEDHELLPETLDDARNAIGFLESMVGGGSQGWKTKKNINPSTGQPYFTWKYRKDTVYIDPKYPKNPPQEYPETTESLAKTFTTRWSRQQGTWWISQAVGDDRASAGTHYATMRLKYSRQKIDPKTKLPVFTKSGKKVMVNYDKLRGSAFDIVLTEVPVFFDAKTNRVNTKENPNLNRPLGKFNPYVTRLRNKGFVAWHRWATAPGEENEIHAIDPASPIVNEYLWEQTRAFLKGWPNKKKSNGSFGYELDWQITDPQKFAVYDRFMGATGSGSKGAKQLQNQYSGNGPNQKGLQKGTPPKGKSHKFPLWDAFDRNRTLENPKPKKKSP